MGKAGEFGLQYMWHVMKGAWNSGIKLTWKRWYWTGEWKAGTLVGEDKFGNKYYEDPKDQIVRDRWVYYSDPKNADASQVPPEWHAWLHHITDSPGQSPQMISLTPKYKLPHLPNQTGMPTLYTPPQFIFNKSKEHDVYEKYLQPKTETTFTFAQKSAKKTSEDKNLNI